MSHRLDTILELNRTFFQVPDNISELNAAEVVYASRMLDRREDWGILLEHPYVVVLGEAGTGKSTEFYQRAHLLAEHGSFSFFLDLSVLAADGLEQTLDVDDYDQLENWRCGQEDAVFFLDSLDEAKLQNHTLRQALRRLHRDLRKEWARVRLVVSCRVSDWMAQSDRQELQHVAPSGVSEVHIVQIAPLNVAQVKQLAQVSGVNDVDAFVSAVVDNNAQVFIERPLDVQWLGTYWVRHKNIGTLRELIADNIREKLRERPGRSSALPPITKEKGVTTLAGIAMVQNAWSFVLPDDNLDVHRAIGAVEPQEFLPDWSSVEIAELLRHPLFDEATYGRVQLHHRSVQEFLAARWLADLVSNGMSHTQIQNFFFRGETDEKAIPSHLVAVAAWFALWDRQLREVLIQEAPELLIGYGDPSGFTEEERRQILLSYAASYAGRERRFERFERASLQRFAVPALSEQIKTLLNAPETPDELISVLLKIIEQGQIIDCVDICLALALDLSRSNHVRAFAIEAVSSIGTDVHRAELLNLCDLTSQWEHGVAGAFVRALYPEPLDVQGLMRVLETTVSKPRHTITSLQFFLEHDVPNIGSTDLRLELLAQLLDEVWVPDAETGQHIIPVAQQWLLPTLAGLIFSILDELNGNEPPEVVLQAIDIFRWYKRDGQHLFLRLGDLQQTIASYPEIKQVLLWRRVEEYRQREGSTPTRFDPIQHAIDIFELNRADDTWLAFDAQTRSNVQERLFAFDALSSVCAGDTDHIEYLHGVAEGIPELTKRLERMLNPQPVRPSPRYGRWDLQNQARQLRQERRESERLAWFESNIDQIRNGIDIHNLMRLYEDMERGHSSYSDIVVASLEQRYGPEIAEAAITGWRTFWRTYEPPMRHECESYNSRPVRVVIGLVGLHLDFADDLDATQLSPEEARLAARYALYALNAFPDWMAPLAMAHQGAVETVLSSAVAGDMIHTDGENFVGGVLNKILRFEVIRRLLAPCVARHLSETEPPILGALVNAIDIVVGEGAFSAEGFNALAHQRCANTITEPRRFATWWEAWLSSDASGSLDFLETVITSVPRDQAYEIVLHICDRLYKCNQTYAIRSLMIKQQPRILQRLIPIVYEYIKPIDDPHYESAHWLGPRDNAQEVRSHLTNWLAEIPEIEAVRSLRELAEDDRLASIRDWLLHMAEQRLVANSALVRLEVSEQLIDLCKTHGTNMSAHVGDLEEEEQMERFDVGIVTMKEEEYDALLDKFGPTEHLRGAMQDYEVVCVETNQGECRVAIIRCIQQGNAYAQDATVDMIADLNPQFILVVGIAGGVPTTDFGLGDVVVSNYIQNLTLEDTGVGPGHERFNALGGPLHPEAARIVGRLRAITRKVEGWNSAEFIGCERPGPNCEHTTDDEAWNLSIDEAITTLQTRVEPTATAQKFASSDRLVKAPELLQKWRSVLKAVAAVEMESAGAYVACHKRNVPFLAIRGISDIVGCKRDDAWTLYACHTAAAYTKMLVDSGAFIVSS